MFRLRALFSRVRALIFRRRIEDAMDEELRAHLEMLADDFVRAGVSPDEARRRARLRLGGIDQTKEATRDARGFPFVDQLLQDLRYGWRTLRRSPSYSVAALLTLGIGIGATTAIFSVADAVALRPLPYQRSDRLFGIYSRPANGGRISTGVSSQDFLEWRDHHQVFTEIGLVGGGAFTLIEGEPEELRGCKLTGDVFTALGARPVLGRIFGREHEVEGNHRVAVLSYGFWQRRFAGDPHIVGRKLLLDDGSYEVVGVMPADFKYPPAGRAFDLWVPFTFDADDRAGRNASPVWGIVARLKDAVTPAQATANLDTLSARLPRPAPVWGSRWRPFLVPLQDVEVVGDTRGWMLLLLGAAAFVLLVACANVAHLALARGSGRTRELAIRSALGGGRLRLARQLVTESLLLSGLATGVGVLLAWGTVRLFGASVPTSLRRISDIALNARVLDFAVLAGILTAVVCGVVPAVKGAKIDVVDGLKEGAPTTSAGRHGRRIREALTFTEVAVSFVLLAGAALFILSFARLVSVNPGFDVDNVINLQIEVPRELNRASRGVAAQNELLERIRHIPGVAGAGVIRGGWMFGGGRTMFPAHKPGEPRPTIAHAQLRAGEQGRTSDEVWVTPGLFRALGVPVLRGRDIGEQDGLGTSPVIVVNQTAARYYWPGGNPVGEHLVLEGDRAHEVVGVVGDIAHLGSDARPRRELYIPLAQSKSGTSGSIVVRTTRPPADVMPAIRQAVHAVWPHQPISRLATLDDDIARASAARRFNMLVMTVFGILALVIAVSGLNGVMAYSVARRRHEMGIRTALGARPAQLLGLVLGRGALVIAAGLAAGVTGAWMLGRVAQRYLFEVRAHDPAILLAVALVLGVAALGACWLPARRAARIDPIMALRCE
jgi:putative ABC transport system permease protein